MGDAVPGGRSGSRPRVRLGGQRRLGALGIHIRTRNGGTRLTESWELLPAGIAGFGERFGADADAQIEIRYAAAKSGIPATLAAMKKTVES